MLLIITNVFILILQVFNFLDMWDEDKLASSTLLMCEKLSNICSYKIFKRESYGLRDTAGQVKEMLSELAFLDMTFFKPNKSKQKQSKQSSNQ